MSLVQVQPMDSVGSFHGGQPDVGPSYADDWLSAASSARSSGGKQSYDFGSARLYCKSKVNAEDTASELKGIAEEGV